MKVFGLLIGMTMAMPALAQDRDELLIDRRAPDSYPTLELNTGGLLDGADRDAALQTATEADMKRALFTVLARHGCRIGERELEGILAPEGFGFEFVSTTLADLEVQGVATRDANDKLSIPASLCPPENPAPTPKDHFVRAMLDNDCSLTEFQISENDRLSQFDEDQLLAITGRMRDTGEIEIDGPVTRLSPSLCNVED